MENFWENFINYNGGEYFARNHFNKLCAQLLSHYYPGKKVVNVNKLDVKEEGEELLVIYLPKFFIDGLTNSRKSQIRKAFNKTIESIKDKELKIFKWVFCTPYVFSEDEQKWWIQWRYRNEDQYKISIELLDGNKIVELLKKYEILDLWSEKQRKEGQNFVVDEEQEELLDLELSELETNEVIDKKQTDDYASANKTPKEEVQPEEKIISSESNRNEQDTLTSEVEYGMQDIEEEQLKTSTGEQVSENKSWFSKEAVSKILKHKRILDKIVLEISKLSKEEKEFFDKQRQISDFDLNKIRKDFEEIDNLPKLFKDAEPKALDLYSKGKAAEVNKEYAKALLFYELLKQKGEEFKKLFREKTKEIENSFKKSELNLVAQEKILEGDILFSRDKKLEAFEAYEEALKIVPQNKEAKVKYNELFGDLLMQTGLYKQAEKAYKSALDNLSNKYQDRKQLLNQKKKIASFMSSYTAINKVPVLGDILLLAAKFLEEKNPDGIRLINEKEYTRLNRFYLFSAIVVLLFILFIGFKQINFSTFQPSLQAISAVSLDDIAIAKGDYFMKKFETYKYSRVHVLDSAIKAYQRASVYNKYDNAALKKYQKAKYYLDAYIELANRRLKEKPQQFFKVVKPESEGLRLVKYLYDPAHKGLAKFGYIDNRNNMVIPPLFDFDYNRRMKEGRESFHNGRAFVCVVIRPGDTAYFEINRYGRRVSRVYFVGE